MFSTSKFALFLPILAIIACAVAPHNKKDIKTIKVRKFVSVLETDPNRIWAQNLNDKLRNAIADYLTKKPLPSEKIYGESVRKYSLVNKCLWNIAQDMNRQGCKRKLDVLKNPQTKKPLVKQNGQTIPLIVYLCDDGGVIRIKPQGDPTNKFKPQPIASKALRYPFDSKFENFDDEILKVDNFGNPIPKWTQDMNPQLGSPKEQADLIEGWADDAHTDLALECPKS